MVETPSEKPDDEKEAERRFQETLSRLVNTPHKPHKRLKPKQNKTGAKLDKKR